MKNFIVSLRRTRKEEPYITLWLHNDRGYCWFKDMAGFYTEIKEGYHRSENSVPISEEIADQLFTEVNDCDTKRLAILNTKTNMAIIKAQQVI